jgi:tRNA threonylcarbamoyl adenosine modification protein YeaZ
VVAVAEVGEDVRRGRTLVPLIERLLADAGLTVGDLALIACGVGPGSFTGIRIGIATAAALAYAADKPVAPVGSLHGIAHNAPDAEHVLVCLDARRGNVYSARFDRLALVGEYAHGPRPTALPEGTVILGDDAPVRPDVIARLGWESKERVAPHEVRPLYMRRSDPEIRQGR